MRRGNIYATAAIVGIELYLFLQWLGLASTASTLLGMGTIVSLRLAAIIYGLSLPIYRLPDSSPPP